MSLLKQKYFEVSAPALKEQFGLKNVMQVPRLQKIVLNMGVGEATQNPKLVEEAAKTLAAITGQKAIVTRAKKAISNFKLRENQAIGAKVTLHGNRMYEFLERLIHISLPRVRDFRGVSRKGFDGRGNYTLGIKEQIIFLEIDFDKVETILGMNITFVTSAPNDEQSYALLEGLGMPFRKN
ncbi:MAG: 50S ribosomal protein L5 [Fibrobacterota bacterium]|nr:50S ribosomal protein L5 [Fibrobacterota bacterium]QQS06865.1 MAG: 50S ribosomal protein L5 [Fibrobacterota bacterium]